VVAVLEMFSDVVILKPESIMLSKSSKISFKVKRKLLIKEKYRFLKDLKK
jgi:hypothetical protein